MDHVNALRSVPVFAGLSDAQLASITGIARAVRAAQHTAILREGETGDSVFILVKGLVEVTRKLGLVSSLSDHAQKEKVLVRLHAPQFFGEMCLLEGAERSATVTARVDCELLEIARSDFERLAQSDHGLGYMVVRNMAIVMSSRLRRADRDIVKLTAALSLALGNR